MTERRAPLSYGQELFWLLDSATPGLLAYNVPRAFRVSGPFDVDAFEGAVRDFVARHEVLHSVYRQEGDHAVQVVLDGAVASFERVDLSTLPPDARQAELKRALSARAEYHFDLSRDVLFRATVFRLGDNEHVVFTLTHHIVSDGWTKSVTFRELSELYAAHVDGRAPTLEPLAVQFGDFAERQRKALSGDALEDDLAYWREQLHGPLPVLDLPSDPNPNAGPFAGDVRTMTLPADLVAAMRQLGQSHGASLYMVLLAAYQTLLHRYSGQDDVIVGSPTAGREEEDTHDLVGYLAGALVLRTSFAGDPSFGELLQRVADTCLDAYEHQAVPFERLVLELQERKNLTHAPLFQCVLTMEDTVPAQLTFGTATLAELEVGVAATKFNLVLLFSEQNGALRLRLAYRTALIDAARAERFLGHFRTLLEAAVASPGTLVSALPLLTASERTQLDAWNATSVSEGAPATLVALVEAQAARVGARAAVIGQRTGTKGSDATKIVELSYASLDQLANQLAHQLRLLGAARNAPIGLLLDRSVESIVAVLGILKAGGAFMPLSVDAPPARLARQLAESGATIVVTDAAHAGQLPPNVQIIAVDRDAEILAALPQTNPTVVLAPEDLAYVLFTSGSTGTPKGVAVTHANAVHYARAVSRVLADVPSAQAGDGLVALDGWTFGLASTLAADLGHTSLWPALLAGGTLHVLDATVTTEPARFATYMTAHPLDVLKVTPGHLSALLVGKLESELSALVPRRWTVLGGEALRPAVARTLIGASRGRVLNHYGPTETTVGALTCEVTRAGLEHLTHPTVPLGRPLANGRAYVCDASGNEQPIGVPGELWLGGPGVARGYLNRDDLTAERFVTRSGERVYRTGDRATRLADGTIEFLGRIDDQVKVRGYRVELGEIEALLQSHPSVARAVVVLRVQDEATPSLVAYVAPKQGGYAASHAERPTAQALTAWLADQLPDYMVPSAVLTLDALPLTANGKVDRAALPAPEGSATEQDRHVAPRTATEETVARIWRDVLKRDQVGVTDSFLDLGGHSLLAIRVLGRISKELGVRLALRALFDSPTVAQIAALIDGELRQRTEAEALRQALAAVEALSDGEAERLLAESRRDEHA